MSVAAALRDLAEFGAVQSQEPLSRHTTFGIGGPADIYFKAPTQLALIKALDVSALHALPLFLLGSGSNILVGDGGVRGIVVENQAALVETPAVAPDGAVRLGAESGLSFASLARRLCRAGYTGLDWAVGIPGSMGGAVVYNAGAYGGCLADVLLGVDVADRTGSVEHLPAHVLGLEYRGSSFTRGLFADRVVLGLQFHLRHGDPASIAERVTELDRKRRAAQPPGRNAGSVFKNPDAKPAWWYIDQVGLRGARQGGAQISPKHANFFMNVDGARAADVKALMNEAARRVQERFGIDLHPEIGLVGEGFGECGAPR
jgi:UDP-N-acetylmuramate dehydrogenase